MRYVLIGMKHERNAMFHEENDYIFKWKHFIGSICEIRVPCFLHGSALKYCMDSMHRTQLWT